MLRTIHIKRFGLFRDRSFVLGPVTVFTGANQSGKSTLFDAIRIAGFHPERRSKENRALYARYGEPLEVSLDWEAGAPPEMGDAEFMNLFAVASGHLAVNLNGDWLAAVKRNLFAGGIDPQNLIAEFQRAASEKGTLAHMRALGRLETERQSLQTALEEKRAQRDEIVGELDAQRTRQAELKGLEAGLGTLKGQEQTLAEELAQAERIAERNRLEGQLALLDEVAALERRQEEQRHLASDRTAELDALEQALRDAEAGRVRAEQSAQTEQERLDVEQAALADVEAELGRRRAWRRGITGLQARLAEHQAHTLSVQFISGLAAVLVLALGALLWVQLGRGGWGWVAFLVGLALAVGAWWLPTRLREWRLMHGLRQQWRSELGGGVRYGRAEQVLESRNPAELGAALVQAAAELEGLEADQAERAGAVREQEGRREEARQRLEAAEKAAEKAGAALRDWLGRLRVGSRDEYRDRLAEFRRDQQALAERYGRLERLLAEAALPDAFHLRAEAGRRLAELDAEGVPREGLSEEQRQALRRELEQVRGELEKREQERTRLAMNSHGASERLLGRLGGLPEEIAGLAEHLRTTEAEMAEIEFNRKAAVRALELFEAVAADESAVLADLSTAVSGTFATLSGLESARQAAVALAGLRNEAIQAVDRQGAPRPVEHLSSGAQHLLYLALRLEMARRERQGRWALLCLDEPFAFLDPDRQLETLTYLRRFLEETGWQLVLFTNEPAQAERARAVFPDCRLHVLG